MTKETKELRRTYWALLTSFALLIVMGMANVFSATFVSDGESGRIFYYHLMRQFIFFAVGMIPAVFIFFHDYRFWRKYVKWSILFAVALLVIVLTNGIVVNGARRWLGLGLFTFQPSEIAKIAGILYAAARIADFLEKDRPIEFFYRLTHSKEALPWQRLRFIPHISLWAPAVMALLVWKQPDAGTAIVILGIPAIMLFVAGAHLSKVRPLLVGIVAVVVIGLIVEPYRMDRIVAWLDPWEYERTLGYQSVQGLIAIGSGGIMGQGIGEGVSKFSYLPEAHTDFAFAIIAQEWGLRGSVVVLLLFCAVIYFGSMAAQDCRDRFGKFTAVGITMYLGGQGFINIAMVCGILPVVGVPLPFISYGGTSLIVNMAAAALLLNICRQNYKASAFREKLSQLPPHPMEQGAMKSERFN